MVQSLNSQNQYGTINKIGTSPDGRVVYKVTDSNGEIAGGLSIAQNDSDKFESSYNKMMTAAPKLEKYMQTHSEEDIKRRQKQGKWIIGGFTLVGGMVPALFSHKITPKTGLQILITLAGTVLGLFAGIKSGTKFMTPPGAIELQQATQEISKLDIQPLDI